MRVNRSYGIFIFGNLFFLMGIAMAKTEEAHYSVLSKDGDIETRMYAGDILAQVEVVGERKEALNKGFRLLADYIFGNNTVRKNIEMTAPVMQEISQKIPMTAPVMQEPSGNKWIVSFVMPAHFTLQTLPKPNNNKIQIVQRKPQKYLAIRFSGFSSGSNFEQHTKILETHIKKNNIQVVGNPVWAQYNPPWTLPFWRRNEVMFRLEH